MDNTGMSLTATTKQVSWLRQLLRVEIKNYSLRKLLTVYLYFIVTN